MHWLEVTHTSYESKQKRLACVRMLNPLMEYTVHVLPYPKRLVVTFGFSLFFLHRMSRDHFSVPLTSNYCASSQTNSSIECEHHALDAANHIPKPKVSKSL